MQSVTGFPDNLFLAADAVSGYSRLNSDFALTTCCRIKRLIYENLSSHVTTIGAKFRYGEPLLRNDIRSKWGYDHVGDYQKSLDITVQRSHPLD
jgi:hypothetical protein